VSTPSISSLAPSAARLAAVAHALANLTHEYALTADREAEVAA